MHDFAESEVFQECIYVVAEPSVLRSSDRWLCWRIPSWLPEFHTHQATFWSLLASQVPAGKGDGTPLQYSCLENPMHGGAWWAAVHGVVKSRTWLSDFTFTFHFHALEKEMANPLQCSCLENPRDWGAWWAAIYGVAQSWIRLKQLSSSSSKSKYLLQRRSALSLCFSHSLFKNWSLGLCINPFELVAEPWLEKWMRLVSLCS